jgi:hypothetical protein
VFLEVDLANPALPKAPETFGPFLAQAGGLLEEAERLDDAALAARLGTLPLPSPADAQRAEEQRRARLRTPHGGTLRTLFARRGAEDSHLYALRTLVSAASQERKASPPRPGAAGSSPTLDCPLVPELGPWPWLELSARTGPPTLPTLLWTQQRLLLVWGAPPALMLSFLVKEDHPSPKRWPLTTAQSPAVDAARCALGEAVVAALARQDCPWEQLFEAVASRA